MKQLKELIQEKLKVSKKYISDINLVDFVNCNTVKEYEDLLEKLRKEIKENGILAPIKQRHDKLYTVVETNTNHVYIFINKRAFFIGTYDKMYYVFANHRNKRVIVNTEYNYGFKGFTADDNEIQEYGGIYYLPEYLEESYNELIEHAENYM